MKKSLLDLFEFNQSRTENELRLKFKVIFLNSVFLSSAVIALGVGIYHWQQSALMGGIDFGFFGISLSLLYYLKRHKEKVELISTIALSLYFLLFFAIYILATNNAMRLVLFFLLAAAVFYLKGRIAGRAWLILILITIVTVHLIPRFSGDYSHFDIITTCLYLTALFLIFRNYERLSENQLCMLVTHEDITERKKIESTLQENEARLRLALQSSGMGAWDLDLRTKKMYWSPEVYQLFGLKEFEPNLEIFFKLVHPDDVESVQLAFDMAIQERLPFHVEFRFGESEKQRWVGERGEIQYDDKGNPLRVIGTVQDITEHKERENQLELIAHYDALTGVPNRVLLADRFKQLLARTKREQKQLAVCYVDLDGFKPINVMFGHDAGDRVLVEISQRIQQSIREEDTIARLGSDEFVVLLVGLQEPQECEASLHRLLESINRPIEVSGKKLSISASIGVTIYPDDDHDTNTLLRHADQAMYIAKQGGKNRYHLFDVEHDQRARSYHDMLQQIRHGLEHDEFELYYQPKVELITQRLIGAEALIRWHHPQRGFLSPGEFLHYIANTQLEIELGDWVINNAINQLRQWREAGLKLEVSVNVSAFHLESEGFVDKLKKRILQNFPQPTVHFLQIEVLETSALEDMDKVSVIISSCKEVGVGFALDDFGAGYSSLTYLSHLDVDALKIDQSFVRKMLEDKGNHAIVLGIISLAKAFEMWIVAEGVENDNIYQELLKMGCNVGQGYGISPPLPASELASWRMKS
jgi:diguanylate cyclase (GGDEF)-like protein/PAS domain S-box-containing protein